MIDYLKVPVCLAFNLESDREMNEVEIEVVEAQVLQGLVASQPDVLTSVEGVPELAGHVKVLPAAKSGFYGSPDPVANLKKSDSSSISIV